MAPPSALVVNSAPAVVAEGLLTLFAVTVAVLFLTLLADLNPLMIQSRALLCCTRVTICAFLLPGLLGAFRVLHIIFRMGWLAIGRLAGRDRIIRFLGRQVALVTPFFFFNTDIT